MYSGNLFNSNRGLSYLSNRTQVWLLASYLCFLGSHNAVGASSGLSNYLSRDPANQGSEELLGVAAGLAAYQANGVFWT